MGIQSRRIPGFALDYLWSARVAYNADRNFRQNIPWLQPADDRGFIRLRTRDHRLYRYNNVSTVGRRWMRLTSPEAQTRCAEWMPGDGVPFLIDSIAFGIEVRDAKEQGCVQRKVARGRQSQRVCGVQ